MSYGTDAIKILAENIDRQNTQEREYRITALAIKLKKYMVFIPEEIEQRFAGIALNCEPKYWTPAIIKATHSLFGDPKRMYESDQTKQFAKAYWNPTAHRINVHPLGLFKANVETNIDSIISFVEPGERVFIPHSYTLGGKHSSLNGVAPQLIPVPVQETEDTVLDLGPTTFLEWTAFFAPKTISPCCKKQVLWSDKLGRLLCQKCGERCTGC